MEIILLQTFRKLYYAQHQLFISSASLELNVKNEGIESDYSTGIKKNRIFCQILFDK